MKRGSRPTLRDRGQLQPRSFARVGFFQAVRRLVCSYEEMVWRIAEMALDGAADRP